MRRFRPSPAMVVACIALFVALGGVAVGAVVITSNSQVDRGTIAGHHPPAGDHPNIIAGSINGKDVAGDSLGGAAINESSLAGVAHRLDYNTSANGDLTTIATVGPYAIKGVCDNPLAGFVRVRVFVNGPAGTADTMWSATENDNFDDGNFSDGELIPTTTNTEIFEVDEHSVGYRRIGGRSILRSGSSLVQIDFEATANVTSNGKGDCFVYGTATRAT